MTRRTPLAIAVICLATLAAIPTVMADAQRGGRGPARPPGHVAVRGHTVFVGGYFYDPHFGPYPWWLPGEYPYWYYPVLDQHADLRVLATPKEAAVYVDGFYAGVVDDFNGIFQSLPLPPGGHGIALFYEGYRTVRQRLYLSPGSTFKWHETMERLPAGTASESPVLAPPVPPPPEHSVVPFRTPPVSQPAPLPPGLGAPLPAGQFGTLAIQIQPASADVTIDGERWLSADAGRFAIVTPIGSHRVEVAKPGYQPFSTETQVRPGETTTVNVSLSKEKS